MEQNQMLQLIASGLLLGGIYALIAAGYVIVFNVTGIINFAQGEFVMLGALIAISLVDTGLPLVVGVLLSIAIVTGLGMAMECFAIRPARNASLVTFIIITIGLSTAIRGLALLFWGTDPYSLPPFSAGGVLTIFGAKIVHQGLWILLAALVCFALLRWFFDRTYLGKAVRACVINPQAARLMGISPRRMSLLAFALAGGMGALAGTVIAPVTMATYDMGLMLGLKGFVAAVLGGLTRIPGAIIGGLILGVAEALSAGLISTGYKDAIAFLVLALILFFLPNGILGETGGKRV